MFTLTCKADYALLALAGLARWGHPVSAREIAERLGLPGAMLRNILKELTAAGVLESTQGATGGYALAQPPDRISVGAVLEVVEGPFRLARCCGPDADHDHACPIESSCAIRHGVHRLHDRIDQTLREMTLAELTDTAADPPATEPATAAG